ncbi:unnamed protein product [Acanthoscelides obtectus]|uniref:HTH psq-type domain-containing protein n=1 Tax=Acanthoscelides obtectus TaxID=200917 RepID=A0A9P0L8X5_ACAOB|nr:unnamed protein product [Acanthoscelides obtectus]CAK1624664.1 hypothetical protein AOBTE_LOCUS2683 [Acanthoscelides obtectus]
MIAAIEEVKGGSSVNGTAKKYKLPEATLRRYAEKYSEEDHLKTVHLLPSNLQLDLLKHYLACLNSLLLFPRQKKTRKKLPSLYITSTPVKDALEGKEAEKKIKEEKKKES